MRGKVVKHFFCFLMANLSLSLLAESPFFVVMYDHSSKQELGDFPISREYYTKAIEIAKSKGASAVVLKFFFDKPGDEKIDAMLADSMTLLPVFLQARIDEFEKAPNSLSSKAKIKILNKFPNTISAKSGWIPIRALSEQAYSIGFVDIRISESIPIVEKYQGEFVQSLTYSVLKYSLPNLEIIDGYLVNGRKRLKINKYGEVDITFPQKDDLEYVTLNSFISGKVKEDKVKGKIIIIGYDDDKIDKISTPIGSIRSHRVFIYGLSFLYEMLK